MWIKTTLPPTRGETPARSQLTPQQVGVASRIDSDFSRSRYCARQMDSESIDMNGNPTSQEEGFDATEDLPVAEPPISFDFISGPEFELASTDDGSQDIASAAIMALVEGEGEEKDSMAIARNDVLEENTSIEDSALEQDDVAGGTETFGRDQQDTPEQKDATFSPKPSLLPVNLEARGIEVVIPQIPAEQRAEYSTVESEVIEAILQEEKLVNGDTSFRVMFTDGREDKVSPLFS